MIQEYEIFRDCLREARLRMTPQRKTVLRVFLKIKGHVNIEGLFEAVQQADDYMGIATVYRAMSLLAACGLGRGHTKGGGKGARGLNSPCSRTGWKFAAFAENAKKRNCNRVNEGTRLHISQHENVGRNRPSWAGLQGDQPVT